MHELTSHLILHGAVPSRLSMQPPSRANGLLLTSVHTQLACIVRALRSIRAVSMQPLFVACGIPGACLTFYFERNILSIPIQIATTQELAVKSTAIELSSIVELHAGSAY